MLKDKLTNESAKEELKYVGRPLPLDDAKAKVTGKLIYTGDMHFPDMLYTKFVLSSVPHALIKEIDCEEANKIPGVVKIFYSDNTPSIPYNSHEWYSGANEIEDQVLFPKEVKFVGDFVAAVVATDKITAEMAASLIKVKYEELPFIVNPNDAIPFEHVEMGCGDNLNDVFDNAYFVSEDVIETQKIHHAAIENHVCIALPDYSNDKLVIYTPCQIMYSVRLIVSKVLSLPMNKVKVIKTKMGGSFGGKQEVTVEPYAAYFAMSLGKPVMIELSRRESIISTRTRTKTIGAVKTAVNKDLKIVGRDVKLIVDTGAYTTNGPVIARAMGKKIFRLYKIPSQKYAADVVITNTPIAGAARGYGSPQIHAITEINIENTARRLGLDPLEFRLLNLAEPYDIDLSGGPSLGNIRIIDCVLKGAEEFDWKNRYKRETDKGRYKRGAGMACASHVNGYYGAYQDFTTMILKMNEDGSLTLNSSIHDLGTGILITLKQIIAEVLDTDISSIDVMEGNTDTSPYDIGCQASRVTHICGACALKVAEQLKKQIISETAKLFCVEEDEIIISDGAICMKYSPDIKYTYGDIASLIQKKNHRELIAMYTYEAQDNPASSGVNFAEVEVDTLTGLVTVKEIVAVFDVGKAINPAIVEGQIHGGINMGLGYALSEDLNIRSNGEIINDSFSRYCIFNAPEMPKIRTFLVEKGGDLGPFGAKSIGEIATIPTAPAVVNAINNALGTYFSNLPVTPEKIIRGLYG